MNKQPQEGRVVRSEAYECGPQTAQSVSDVRFGDLVQRTIVLMNPLTWFAPAWAFLCGAVGSGALEWSFGSIGRLVVGILMAGPVLCGLSQVINDYCDREVDAINQPERPVPSGLISLRHIQIISFILTVVGSGFALLLGPEVALLVGVGLLFALSYSLKPVRAKRNGWFGNALVAISYEGLAWVAGFAAMTTPATWGHGLLWPNVLLAGLYSLSAHGIMTVNDFKSMAGDAQLGLKSIPVMYGKKVAAWLVVSKMVVAQVLVIGLLAWWGNPVAAVGVGLLLMAQVVPFRRFASDPEHNEVFFNTTGIMLSVWGMLVAALGVAY